MSWRASWLVWVVVSGLGCGEDKSPGATGGAPGHGGSSSATGGNSSATGGAQTTTGGKSNGLGGVSAGGASSGGSGGKALDPSVLSEQPVAIDELALNASRVVWLEGHNRILSLPLAGGTPSVVYASTTPGQYEALHIAVDETQLYFTDQGHRPSMKPRGVFAMPLDGSAERALLSTANWIDQLAVGGGYVYFTADDCIVRVSTSGGAATVLVRNIKTETPLVVHEGYVYFWYAASAADNSEVFRVAVDTNAGTFSGAGGASSAGGTGGTGGSPIAAEKISNTTRYSELILAPKVDGGYVYWSIFDELYRFPVAGGAQEQFGVLDSGSITLLLVAQGDVYWGGGSVRQFVVGGNSNTLVTAGLEGIRHFVANDSHLFLADGKLLRRVARP